MNNRIILWGGLIVVMAIIVFAMVRIAGEEEEITEPIITEEAAEAPEILDVRENDWAKGNPDAGVVIVKYSDFQCPACRFYASFDHHVSQELDDEVLFVRRFFPLRSFQFSRLAAQYAEAAGRQGQFWEMHDLLYINQQNWSRGDAESIFRQFAEELGLNIDQLQEDLNDPEIMERIEADYTDGQQLGIRGVPTIYINGEQVQLPNSVDAYRDLIESYK